MKQVLFVYLLLPLVVVAQPLGFVSIDTNAVRQVCRVQKLRKIPAGASAGEGIVIRLLEDDTEGSRHQRFIIREPDDTTLLMVHNIDLAPRIPIARGDTIHFCGEYVWNNKGGLIHWTHRDSRNRHFHGWIYHKGKYYE